MQQRLVIEGGHSLQGTVRVSGAKNAVLKLMAAALLGKGEFVIHDVPAIKDVFTMNGVLRALGADLDFSEGALKVKVDELSGEAPEDLVSEMRASLQVMGPLLAKLGWVRMSLPGGCAIGDRPIDLHLKNLSRLGVEFSEDGGIITGHTRGLVGAELNLDFPSVGATENLMMAATLAKGVTTINNAAREPEIVDVQCFLNKMGAEISGAGTGTITITGVADLGSTDYRVIPDRIEAGTHLIIGGLLADKVEVTNVRPDHLVALLAKFKEVEIPFLVGHEKITVWQQEKLKPSRIITQPYPGFPTDLQPQFLTVFSVANGTSVVKETIYPNRFGQVDELRRMGASIIRDGNCAVVNGVNLLQGAKVHATDLRAGAGLIIAGLVAQGRTELTGLEHIDRGYERLVEKLSALGAKIKREG